MLLLVILGLLGEGKNPYEALILGIWKIIWIVKKQFLEKKLFLGLYGWYIWAKNGDFRRK
jgi:hypothetical protein